MLASVWGGNADAFAVRWCSFPQASYGQDAPVRADARAKDLTKTDFWQKFKYLMVAGYGKQHSVAGVMGVLG